MLKNYFRYVALIAAIFFSANSFAAPKVSVSILPLHDLVKQIGQGVFTPDLLLNPNLSPHDAALKPSQIASINKADLVVWIGPSMESNLYKIIKNLELPEEKVMTLIDNPKLDLVAFRPTLALGQQADHRDHHDGHSHHAGATDPHIWLSFNNAENIVNQVSEKLMQIDAKNANTYNENRQRLLQNMQALKVKLADKLAAVNNTPYLLLHDAQQYFDKEFDLAFAGSLVQHSMHELGAKSMQNARQLSDEKSIACIFIQPQFISERSMQNLADNLGVGYAVIDHIGMTLENTDMAWQKIMRNIADKMVQCLSSN